MSEGSLPEIPIPNIDQSVNTTADMGPVPHKPSLNPAEAAIAEIINTDQGELGKDPHDTLSDIADMGADLGNPTGNEARSQEIYGTPAEGMDLDIRYENIKGALKQEWLDKHPGKDFLTTEGQNYQLGDPSQPNLPTLKDDVSRVFKERYPDDTEAYALKERTRIYENQNDDPLVQKIEQDIIKATNTDPQVRAANTTKGTGSWGNTWDRINARESINRWNAFVGQYPEKSKAYADRNPAIKKALEFQQQRQTEQIIPFENPVHSLPQRRDFKLLSVGATAYVTLSPGEQEQLSKAQNQEEFNQIRRHIIDGKTSFVVERNPRSAEIAQHLFQSGLPVERLEKPEDSAAIPLEPQEYVSSRLGDSDLQKDLQKFPGEERNRLLTNYADLLGNVNRADVVYGNNHYGNFITDGEQKVSLIDFKTSQRANFDWQQANADNIFNAFFTDLALVGTNLKQIGCNDDEIQSTVKRLVDHFPLPDPEKIKLINKMLPTRNPPNQGVVEQPNNTTSPGEVAVNLEKLREALNNASDFTPTQPSEGSSSQFNEQGEIVNNQSNK